MRTTMLFVWAACMLHSGVAAAQAQKKTGESPTSTDEAPAPVLAKFSGFRLRSDGGAHQLRIAGLVQADRRTFLAEEDPPDTFLIRRTRLDVRATVAKYFHFRLHPEFAGSSLVLLDATAEVALFAPLRLVVGKMKSPVGLEVLQSPTTHLFPETGLPSALIPNRDVGALLTGELAEVVSYSVGVFNGVSGGRNGDVDDNGAVDLAGRVFVTPFARTDVEAIRRFGVGVAGTWGEQVEAQQPHRSAGRRTFFAYEDSVVADGVRTRISPQGHWFFGPVGVLGEVILARETLTNGAESGVVNQAAWQVYGSVIIGGDANYKGPTLRSTLDPSAGTWGALEIAARVGQLDVDHAAFDLGFAGRETSAQRATNAAGSLSWWLAPATRAVLAYDFTTFNDGAEGADRADEHVLIARLQLGF